MKINWRLWTRAQIQKVVVLQLGLRQVGLGGAAVNFGQGTQHVLEHVQQQSKQRSIFTIEVDALFGEAFQRLRRVRAHFVHVGSQETPAHHKQYLILVIDVIVGQKLGQQLIQHNPKGIDVRLK